MTTRIHTKIGGTIVVALAIAAVAVPGAAKTAPNGSHVVPNSSINYREPGSTGYLPRAKFSLSYTEPGSTGYVPVGAAATAATATATGFDWPSALIGAGVVVGAAVACAGGITAARRRRGLAHV